MKTLNSLYKKYIKCIISEGTYWDRTGQFEADYEKFWDELVPEDGKCATVQGELLRAAGRLYYRWYNDGDRIVKGGELIDGGPSTMNAWGYLSCKADEYEELSALPIDSLAEAESEEEYEEMLEHIVDEVIVFIKNHPEPIPNSEDMLEDGFQEICIQECDLHKDEDEDDEDYSDEDGVDY